MKIAIIGYGKMGHLIEQVARERGHEIVAIIDVDNAYDFDSEAFKSADVAIEFSMPSTAYDNVRTCFTKKVKKLNQFQSKKLHQLLLLAKKLLLQERKLS